MEDHLRSEPVQAVCQRSGLSSRSACGNCICPHGPGREQRLPAGGTGYWADVGAGAVYDRGRMKLDR